MEMFQEQKLKRIKERREAEAAEISSAVRGGQSKGIFFAAARQREEIERQRQSCLLSPLLLLAVVLVLVLVSWQLQFWLRIS